jgi:CheY-like chemotaxis protein
VSQGLDNLRIVIVDGQKHVRSALTGFLSGLGSCANSDDVMTPRFQTDLVLSDIATPHKDGFELLREIRFLDPSNGGKVPVIAIIGLSRPQDQMRAPAAGFDAILLKPFTPDLLLKVISEMIQSRS